MTMERYYKGPVSDHFDGTRFFNVAQPNTDRSLMEVLRWRLGKRRTRWSDASGRQSVPAKSVQGLGVSMIGHASVLIQLGGYNLLVDPVWSLRASPLRWLGPHRVQAPGIAFDDLPPIDVVLLSHNHYDHFDTATLRRLRDRDRPRVLAPLGNDAVAAREGTACVIETLDWYERSTPLENLAIWLHPANHWSARGIRDRRMALWGGFVITSPQATVYVSGDTGYGDGRIFRDVRTRYGAPDLAILPIGAYAPRWFMQNQHVDPEEAVQIMQDCGAVQAIGVHWGTFQLADEPMYEPRDRLYAELARRKIPPSRFVAMMPGDSWERSEPR